MLLRLDQLPLDARFGLRLLARSPLVAVVAVSTLAIGIGLNTAVFTLVDAVLLRPLPYPDADRLVWIAPYSERAGQDTFASRGDYRVWKQQVHLFENMTAYGTQDLSIVVGDEASQERVASITGDFWTITGARPRLGRLFPDGDEQGVVLSYGLFQRRFGGQPAVVGRTVEISGASFIIMGVLPEAFRVTFPQQTAAGDELRGIDAFISLPRGQEPPGGVITATNRPAPPWVRVVAKLGSAVSVSRARSGMEPSTPGSSTTFRDRRCSCGTSASSHFRTSFLKTFDCRCWCCRLRSDSCC